MKIVATKLAELQQDLNAIDNDNPVKYWSESISEERNPWYGLGFLGWSQKAFDYSDIPFVPIGHKPVGSVQNCSQYGKFTIAANSPKNGKYSAVYTSGTGENGDAEVQIFVESRDLPANVKRISQLKTEIEKLEQSKIKLLGEIEKLDASIKELELLCGQVDKEEKDSSSKIKRYEESILKLRTSIVQQENEIKEISVELKRIESEMRAKEMLLSAIEEVVSLLSFEGDPLKLIKMFQEALKEYRVRVQGRNLLHVAALNSNKGLILQYGRRKELLDEKDKLGDTPLHLAIQHKKTTSALALILEGANTDIKNNADQTPLDLLLSPGVYNFGIDFDDDLKTLIALLLYKDGSKDLTTYFSSVQLIQILQASDVMARRHGEFSKPIANIIAGHSV